MTRATKWSITGQQLYQHKNWGWLHEDISESCFQIYHLLSRNPWEHMGTQKPYGVQQGHMQGAAVGNVI